ERLRRAGRRLGPRRPQLLRGRGRRRHHPHLHAAADAAVLTSGAAPALSAGPAAGDPPRKQAVMPGRILNRRELRKQADPADEPSPPAPVPEAAVAAEAAPARKPRAARAKAPRKKAKAPRLRARWGVFDGGMKQVAIFDYNQRAAAEEK